MGAALEIQIIAVLIAMACALSGTFLVLRRLAMMSDAISHAILPGIVIAFFWVHDLHSPVLVLAAAAMGVVTSWLIALLARTGRVKEDAAIGIVFPALFAIGVILITKFAGDVHLDIDAVLLGELAFAPFDRLIVAGRDMGPRSLYVALGILTLNVVFMTLFYKELKVSAFDPGLAASLGFMPAVMHYALMSVVSITAVGAFDAVGSILVVALMIAAPATAFFFVKRLSAMIYLSAAIGGVAAIAGYWLAHIFDVSIAGSMATASGLIFLGAFLLAPGEGVIAKKLLQKRQGLEFSMATLAVHLMQHMGTERQDVECREDHLEEHLNWTPLRSKHIVSSAVRTGLVQRTGKLLALTPKGKIFAQEYMGAT